jgi:putative membrane protein
MGMGGEMGMGGYGGVIWAVLGVALIVLVILGIVWLVRQLSGGVARGGHGESPAMREAELRYARGEIDREAYQAIRRDLEADNR